MKRPTSHSATALRRSPLLLRYLADDFSVLIRSRPRVRFVGWQRQRHVLH